MSAAAMPPDSSSPDLAHVWIKEAHRLVGQADQEPVQVTEPEKKGDDTSGLYDARGPKPAARSSSARLISWSLAGLLALACVGLAVLAQSNHKEVVPEPISTSSLAINKREYLTQPASRSADLAAATFAEPQIQAPPQSAPITPIAAPITPELARQIEEISRELANVDKGIDQLKTQWSQITQENAELAEQLKMMREVARHNADLTEDLKTTQVQMAREISSLKDQSKASQDLMATIAEQLRQSQAQVARLITSEQKPRLARRPAPKPPAPLTRAQTQDTRQLLPGQQ